MICLCALNRATKWLAEENPTFYPIPSTAADFAGFDLRLGGDIIVMPALKKAQGRDALILRLQNNTPNAVDSYVQLNGRYLPLHFGKYEVKTVIYEEGTLIESAEMVI